MPNIWTAVTRARRRYFNNEQVDTGFAKGPEVLNNESLQAINAAGSALVDLIKADAANAVTLPNGATIPAGKTLAITDADGLTIGSKIIPQTFVVPFALAGTAPATAANFNISIPIPVAARIVSVRERHATAGNDAGAVTLMVKKVPSGTALAAGTDCLAAGVNLKGTADTNASPALHATQANYTFAAGDAVGFALTGTPTTLAGLAVEVEFQRV